MDREKVGKKRINRCQSTKQHSGLSQMTTQKIINNAEVELSLDEDTIFYTNCGECGKLLEATDDILEDFTGYLFGSTRLICEECSAKRKGII